MKIELRMKVNIADIAPATVLFVLFVGGFLFGMSLISITPLIITAFQMVLFVFLDLIIALGASFIVLGLAMLWKRRNKILINEFRIAEAKRTIERLEKEIQETKARQALP